MLTVLSSTLPTLHTFSVIRYPLNKGTCSYEHNMYGIGYCHHTLTKTSIPVRVIYRASPILGNPYRYVSISVFSCAVLEKFNSFFQVKRNVIFERVHFNCQCQLPGESVEQYIVELYNLVEHCNYRDFKSEMIRDHLVVGILQL